VQTCALPISLVEAVARRGLSVVRTAPSDDELDWREAAEMIFGKYRVPPRLAFHSSLRPSRLSPDDPLWSIRTGAVWEGRTEKGGFRRAVVESIAKGHGAAIRRGLANAERKVAEGINRTRALQTTAKYGRKRNLRVRQN